MDTRRRACTITSRQRRSADRTDRVRRLILGISSDTEPKEVALLIDPGWSASLP